MIMDADLSTIAITKVKADWVFITDTTKVGDVYVRLAKYALKLNPILDHKRKIFLQLII